MLQKHKSKKRKIKCYSNKKIQIFYEINNSEINSQTKIHLYHIGELVIP